MLPSASQDLQRIANYLRGKRVMVTGACGTVGKELIAQLTTCFDIEKLTGLDHNESELAVLEEQYRHHRTVQFFLADIRDPAAMLRVTRNIDVLFHSAGYKHVHLRTLAS